MNNPIGKLSLLLSMTVLGQAVHSRPFSPTFCVAELRTTDWTGKINFRQEPGLDQPIVGTGQNQDLVYLVSQSSPEPDSKKDRSGKTWYRVKLPRESFTGYVREDLLKRYCLLNNQD